jgi:hypothetical protein
MTLTEVGDMLRATPMCWREIPADGRAVAEASLLPNPIFVEGQRHWISRWWLACTQSDVDAINAVLPAHTRVSALDIGGSLYLGSDLLTDSMREGQMYYPAQSVIQRLICTYFDPPPVGQ